MDYRCISADGHIDLMWLPHDLFVANAAAAMKSRMPYVEDTPRGPAWMTKSGDNLGLTNGKGFRGATGSGKPYIPGKEPRLDRMAETGLFSDGSRNVFRPAMAPLRLKDQDRDGIQAEILYGLLGSGNRLTDREAALEFFRIYNEWLADFCGHDRKRLIGLASIPSYTVEAAVAEIRRVAKLGVGGLDIATSWDMIPLWAPYWEPMWRAAADADLPVHFHTIGGPPLPNAPTDLPEIYTYIARGAREAGFQMSIATLLGSIILGGALERYPNLRIVLGESGIGWIPYVLQRMDQHYDDKFRTLIPTLKLKPSEYWRRQCRATFQEDPLGLKLIDLLGEETVMWGSDYPHPDGLFPDSQDALERQFAGVPAHIKHKVTCENAGRFYGLM